MGGHSGRCFRDRKKSARRYARQRAAFADLKRRAAKAGGVIPPGITFRAFSEQQKQKVIEVFKIVSRFSGADAVKRLKAARHL